MNIFIYLNSYLQCMKNKQRLLCSVVGSKRKKNHPARERRVVFA